MPAGLRLSLPPRPAPCAAGRAVQLISCLAAGIKGGGDSEAERAPAEEAEGRPEQGSPQGQHRELQPLRREAEAAAATGPAEAGSKLHPDKNPLEQSPCPRAAVAAQEERPESGFQLHKVKLKTKYWNAAGGKKGRRTLEDKSSLQSKEKIHYAPNSQHVKHADHGGTDPAHRVQVLSRDNHTH